MSFSRDGKQRITVEVDADFREIFDQLKDDNIDVTITKHKKHRSLSANAYFHLLVNKLAGKMGISDSEVKCNLVVEYGALAKDDTGQVIGFKLPACVDAGKIYPYCRCFDTRFEGGREFRCYLIYKHTHDMSSAEMARLIDGAIFECRELGIETDTPAEIARLKSLWEEQQNDAKSSD